MYFCFVKIEIELYCPNCQSAKVVKNGIKSNGKQIIFAKMRNAVANSLVITTLPIKAVILSLITELNLCLPRGVGVRDISVIENVSTGKNTHCFS